MRDPAQGIDDHRHDIICQIRIRFLDGFQDLPDLRFGSHLSPSSSSRIIAPDPDVSNLLPVFFSRPFLLSFNEDLFSPRSGARVAKSRDLSLVSRDQQIVTMKREGKPYSEIADHFGISKARVSQIVSRVYEDVTDDAYREGMRLDIEGKLQVLNKLIEGPGKPMVTPGGKIVCEYLDDGSGDLDFSKPLYDEFVKIDAIKTYVQLLERLARQHATDRPKARDRDESAELAQAMKWVEQVAEDNKRLQKELDSLRPSDIVEAEIVS